MPVQVINLVLVMCILISGSLCEEEEEDKGEFQPGVLLPNITDIEGIGDNSFPVVDVNIDNKEIEEGGDTDSECSIKGSFGCPCNNTSPCNASKSLECIDDTCYCLNSLHRMYDYGLEECVNLIGSPCEPENGAKCITNSDCVYGTCQCRSGFSQTSNRMCFLNAGQKCMKNQCNSDKLLACKNGVCQCIDSMYTFSLLADRCVNPRDFVRKFVNRIGATAADEFVDRKIRKVVSTGLDVLALPLKFIPFVG